MISIQELYKRISPSFRNMLEEIASNRCSSEFDFMRKTMSDEECILIAKVLAVNTSIKYLRLEKSCSSKGFIAIAEGLKRNTSIETMMVGANNLDSETVQALVHVLENNTVLKKITFYNDKLDDVSVFALFEMLRKNTTLTSFHMAAVGNLNPHAGHALAKMIEGNKTLTHFSFYHAGLGSEIGSEIARALSINKTLTDLSFINNKFGTTAGVAFANALTHNTTLKKLCLNNNDFGSAVAREFSKALRINSTLEELYFHNNEFGIEGCLELANALHNNTTVCRLDIDNNLTDDDFPGGAAIMTRIDTLCNRNIRIKPIRKNINNLLPETPCGELEKILGIYQEEFNPVHYDIILENIEEALHAPEYSNIKQTLKDEAMIARCAWDDADDIESRIKQLKDIIVRADSQHPGSIKTKALERIAPIVLDKAMQCSKTGKADEASVYVMEACPAAIHGSREMTEATLCDALSLWLGDNEKQAGVPFEQLLQTLAEHSKFAAFDALYRATCKRFGLEPLKLEGYGQPKKTLMLSKEGALCGDSKSAAEAFSAPRKESDSVKLTTFQSVLSLDEFQGDHERTDVAVTSDPESSSKSEAEDEMLQAAIQLSLGERIISKPAV